MELNYELNGSQEFVVFIIEDLNSSHNFGGNFASDEFNFNE